jgi:hypothetical protein
VLGTLLLYLLVLIIYIAGALCGGIPGLILGLIVVSLSGNTEAGVIAGAVLGIVIFLPLAFYGLARVFPMMVAIIDPKMGQMNPADAMTWSYKRTGRSISTGQGIAWSLVGLTITLGLIMGVCALACGLPYLFFGLPLAAAVVGATYALLSADDINGLLCEHCGYLRHENDSTKCPECGKNWHRTDEAA